MFSVPAAYYINLDSRSDRKRRFEEHWRGIFTEPIQRFSAIKTSENIRGCGASHAELVLSMKTNPSIPFIVVFEDDAERTPDFIKVFGKVIEYAKTHDDWNIVNCGTNTVVGLHKDVHIPPTIRLITPELFSTTVWSNAQTIIYGRGAIPIAEEYLENMKNGMIPLDSHYSHNDVYFSTHRLAKSLITSYLLTVQYPDWSDNQKIESNQITTFSIAALDLYYLRELYKKGVRVVKIS